jgi:hypothetical protein
VQPISWFFWRLCVNITTCLTAIALLSAMFSSATTFRPAFAQAGSTGGTIGKQDKSVSGGSPAATPAPKEPRPHRPLRRVKQKARPAGGSQAHGNGGPAETPCSEWTGPRRITPPALPRPGRARMGTTSYPGALAPISSESHRTARGLMDRTTSGFTLPKFASEP